MHDRGWGSSCPGPSFASGDTDGDRASKFQHAIRGRLNQARRGELALQLLAGLMRDPSEVVIKDPKEVQDRAALALDSFLHLRRARRFTRVLRERDLMLPCEQMPN